METIKMTQREFNAYVKGLKGVVGYGVGNRYTEEYTVFSNGFFRDIWQQYNRKDQKLIASILIVQGK